MKLLRMSQASPTPFIRDLLGTAITSVVTVVCLAAITRLLAEGFGADGFGAYSVARRVVSTIEPLSTLAMGIAVTRYIAMCGDREGQASYLIAGTILVGAPALALLVVGLSLGTTLAQALFLDGTKYYSLLVAMLFFIVAYSFYILLYAYYRGTGRMSHANLWQVSVIAVGPLSIAWMFAQSGSVSVVLSLMAALLFCAMGPLVLHLVAACKSWAGRGAVMLRMRELVRYGLPRVPAGFAFGGVMAVGPLFAPYFGSLKDAGYLVAGQMILRMVEAATEAFGRAALPRIAQVFGEKGKEVLKDRVEDLLSLILQIGSFASIHLLIWSEPLILLWLGLDYAEAILPVRITLVALVPYLAFVTLRAVVDAIDVRAVNAIALYISLAVTIVVSGALAWSGSGVVGLALGTTIGLAVLGSLVGAYVWRSFTIDWRALNLGVCAGTNLVLAVVGLAAMLWLSEGRTRSSLIWFGMAVEGGLFVLYLLWLRSLGARWIQEIEGRLVGLLRVPANADRQQ